MYRVQSNANRATNQMQGAAGTLSAMTKKREVKTEKPEMGIGEMAMQGVGMTMLGLEISENDFVKGLFEGSPESVGQDPAIKEGLFEVKDELALEDSLATDEIAQSAGYEPVTAEVQAPTPTSAINSAPSAMPPGVGTGAAQPVTNSITGIPGAYDVSALGGTMSDVGGGVLPAATSSLEAAPTIVAAETGIQAGTGAAVAGGTVATTTGGAAVTGGLVAGGTTAATGAAAGTAIGAGAAGGAMAGTAATTAATTAAGGVAGAGAGAAGGAQAGSAAGPWGAAAGAAIGLIGSYLFA